MRLWRVVWSHLRKEETEEPSQSVSSIQVHACKDGIVSLPQNNDQTSFKFEFKLINLSHWFQPSEERLPEGEGHQRVNR